MHTTRCLKRIVTGAMTVALCAATLVVAATQPAAANSAKPAATTDSGPAVFRPSNGYWYVRGLGKFHYGKRGDVPVPADYNRDGRVDLAVFRPSNGRWFIRGVGWYRYGKRGDVPVPADYNRDGRAEIAVFRPSNGRWFIRGVGWYRYGKRGDVPVPADYNRDGRVDLAVFRPSNGRWFIRGVGWYRYGKRGDVPVPADYNGDGRVDLAVFRPSNGRWFIRGVGWYHYGSRGAVPVPADYNGDGRVDIAVFQPSNGYWFIRRVGKYQYGRRGDIPVPGRYNNDARADVALFRPSNGYWFIRRIGKHRYGAGTDKPVAHILPAWYPTRTFHGSSDDVVTIGADPDARIVRATYQGSDNFIIWSLARSSRRVDLLVNTIGDYRGTTLLLPGDGAAARLQIKASGSWTVTVADAMKYATHWSATSAAKGTHDEVLTIPGGLAAAKRVRLRYTGADNFIVWADGRADHLDLLANEIGSWSGRELLPRGALYLDITASGSWSITPG